jgi:signal transduction histidine kinase
MPDLDLEGIIHDLNNVFQTIGESADLLRSDPNWTRVAGTLQRSVERGQRIVGGLIESNRSGADLAPVVDNAIQFARDYLEAAHGPKIEFSQHIEPGRRVRGDAAEWERVFVNLLLNAAEAGATHVCIEARDGVINVSDDGHGIPPGLLPQIFQPRVTTKSIMAGLGLYIVQSIVEQNGGSVTAANRTTGGAVFTIRGAG